MPAPVHEWWKSAVVYQVYPRSFADAAAHSGDTTGVGTLLGVIQRLDHLQWLGIDALWLSPIFQSPMADFGYDISDYCAIDPTFGTLADFDQLIDEAHARGIRVLLDWVPNHTSEQHPWFQESRRDAGNPKADWYVWRDEPANNWHASFPRGERAWTFDTLRNQYYLHCFLAEQPDLNWDHPGVEAAMHDTLRFWLDRGVDGFRMDVVHLLGKDIGRDDPADAEEHGWSHIIYNDVAVTHERLRRIRRVLDEYPGERTSVGEVYLLDEAAMADYYGARDELRLCFNFRFLWAPFEPRELAERVGTTVRLLGERGAWPTWALSNHDVVRHRQRYGGGELNARMAAIMLLTLPGTPFLYQGEELGLLDALVPPDQVVDPGLRDGCRAPIPWDASPLHGWRTTPWLPFAPESDTRNVASQLADKGSILHFYRRLLALRRATPALHSAGLAAPQFELLHGSDDLFAWARRDNCETWFTSINPTWAVADDGGSMHGATIMISTDPTLEGTVITGSTPPRVAFIARRDGTM